MFSENVIKELGFYVYALLDANGVPFYIGKGKGNRVFDHVKMCIKDEHIDNLKYDKIRKIGRENVQYIIVRHGLTEKEALLVEAVSIDWLKVLKADLVNIQSGYNSITKGIMSVDEVLGLYDAEELKSIPDDFVIININKSYGNLKKSGFLNPTYDDIYTATRGVWTMAYNRAQKKKYVLSVYKGLVVEVFEVISWHIEKRKYTSSATKHGNAKRDGCVFTGLVAPDKIRNAYINKSIRNSIKRGSAFPIRYNL